MTVRSRPVSSAMARQRRRTRGAIYARYSSRFQHSNDDQIRECREWAEQNGVDVVRVFRDEAKTGRSSRREGLKALQQALENDEIDVVVIFTTNRLYRKMYQSLMFVEEEIVDGGKRCVFVRSGIDTADSDDWRQRLQFHALLDEYIVQTIGKHVHAAHEGLLLQTRVFGTVTFGYTGEEIPNATTKIGRPARRLIIDPTVKGWVAKIFDWFTRLKLSIAEIVRRLNAEGAPLPPRSGNKRWTRLAVRRVLGNARYIGNWAYGSTKAVWLSKKSYGRQIPREEPLRELQIEELRIIDDVSWAKAQERLHNLSGNAGRKPKDGDRRSRPRILNGLLVCEQHERPMYVGGAHGHSMVCRSCQEDPQPFLYTQLPRRLALELLCRKLAELIREDPTLVEEAIRACSRIIEAAGQPDLEQLEVLKRKATRLTENINFILDAPGETEQDREENRQRLERYRRERAEVQRELAELQAMAEKPAQIPDAEELRGELAQLAEVLSGAADAGDEEERAALRQIIQDLTGGRIWASQCGERTPKRGWLRLRFTTDAVGWVSGRHGCAGEAQPIEVAIDVKPPDTTDEDADRVKELCDQGLMFREIARLTGWHRNRVSALHRHWYDSRNLPAPDGRSRRGSLPKKQQEAPRYQQLADDVQRLWREGLSDREIGRRLGCSDTTANKAFAWWHRSRGLPVPGDQDRREALKNRACQMFNDHVPLREIAAAVHRSVATVRKLLKEWHEARGLAMPDGRSRRHRRSR